MTWRANIPIYHTGFQGLSGKLNKCGACPLINELIRCFVKSQGKKGQNFQKCVAPKLGGFHGHLTPQSDHWGHVTTKFPHPHLGIIHS